MMSLQDFLYCLFSVLVIFLSCINPQSKNITLKRRILIFSYLFLLIFLLYPYIGQYLTPVALIGCIFLLTWKTTYKLQNIICFLIGYLIQVCTDYLFSICANLFFHLDIYTIQKSYMITFFIIYFPILFFLTKGAGYLLHKKIEIQNLTASNRLPAGILLHLLITVCIFVFAIMYGNYIGYPPSIILFNGVFFFLYCILSSFLLYFICRTVQRDEQLQSKLIQYKNLTSYVKEVETLYLDMRTFKHDYLDILSSIKGYIDQEDMASLNTYFYKEILPLNQNSETKDSRLGMLSNISCLPLKSLLSAKLLAASGKGIHVNLEVSGQIETFNMNLIDLIRVLGIILNNATEAALDSFEKELTLSLINCDNKITFLIRNSALAPDLPIHVMLQKDQTTKAGHFGIGLSAVSEKLNSCPNILWSIDYKEPYFTIAIDIFNNEEDNVHD